MHHPHLQMFSDDAPSLYMVVSSLEKQRFLLYARTRRYTMAVIRVILPLRHSYDGIHIIAVGAEAPSMATAWRQARDRSVQRSLAVKHGGAHVQNRP